MTCPNCGKENVSSQLFQEDLGSSTISKTTGTSKTKKGGHGFFWFILVGWWIWLPKLILWIVAFIPMLLLKLIRVGKKSKTKSKSTTTESTVRNVQYRTVFTCADCGHTWSVTSK